MTDVGRALEEVARHERAAVIAAVARDVRDLALAEDAFQDACVAAMRQWPERGLPERPAAWLATVARRAALRRLRAAGRSEGEIPESVVDADALDPAQAPQLPDARLELLFACCHRALNHEAQVALTLRTVGGLTTEEIAGAFLVDEVAMAQRLVRARNKVRDSGIPFSVPPPERLDEAIDAVLAVVYLVFNEGYAASAGLARVRVDLCEQALELARLLAELLPEAAEVHGLYGLISAHHARRAARMDERGASVPLEEQDRSLYDRRAVAEAEAALRYATALDDPGPYQIEAAIACAHATAPDAASTDWPRIVELYAALAAITGSAVVELNHAAALGMRDGPDAGLALIDALAAREPRLDRAPVLHATRADLERRAGQPVRARAAYRRAIALSSDGRARRDLELRLARLE